MPGCNTQTILTSILLNHIFCSDLNGTNLFMQVFNVGNADTLVLKKSSLLGISDYFFQGTLTLLFTGYLKLSYIKKNERDVLWEFRRTAHFIPSKWCAKGLRPNGVFSTTK